MFGYVILQAIKGVMRVCLTIKASFSPLSVSGFRVSRQPVDYLVKDKDLKIEVSDQMKFKRKEVLSMLGRIIFAPIAAAAVTLCALCMTAAIAETVKGMAEAVKEVAEDLSE